LLPFRCYQVMLKKRNTQNAALATISHCSVTWLKSKLKQRIAWSGWGLR